MAPAANPLRLPASVPLDWFYAFWLPLSRRLGGGMALAGALFTILVLIAVPFIARRRGSAVPARSRVDEAICTGCTQCSLDCPYEAITMLPRTDGRAEVVARVTPELCVSCGICAGSCAPMGVGPAGRTGRDQLSLVREFLARPERRTGEIVAICCDRSAASLGAVLRSEGAVLYPVDCAGSLHTSVIEMLVRSGRGGVLVLACPPRDCWNREGPRWLLERVYHEREAELQERVDRRRVRIAYAWAGEPAAARAALRDLKRALEDAGIVAAEQSVTIDVECEPVPAGEEP
jgi:Pyruvate/2-oxoacid:ferredoxin oxidoreductase delta subunit/coenzyme F420-reducing hydrogenase delta subunit